MQCGDFLLGPTCTNNILVVCGNPKDKKSTELYFWLFLLSAISGKLCVLGLFSFRGRGDPNGSGTGCEVVGVLFSRFFFWQSCISGLAAWKELLKWEKCCPANAVVLCKHECIDRK